MDNNTIVILLKELIMECNRVSLPCLGSFLSGYSPAVVSDGKIYPPSKAIVFHQNEIWNDEKLENRIAQVNNMSIGVAKEELAFWIDNVCVLLATGEEVLLPGLGRLFVSGQAKLIFEQNSENLLMESFGLEPVDIQTNTSTKNKETQPPDPDFGRKGSNKTLVVGIFIIVLLAAAAIFAIFQHILTDKIQSPPESPVKEKILEINYDEYFTPKYGIIIASFEKLRDARELSKKIAKTSVYCIDTETPYSVILNYTSSENVNKALDSLKNNYPNAYIVELGFLPEKFVYFVQEY
jgi:hypothetical protein